jgi:NAD(P)H-dependent FMN reductase
LKRIVAIGASSSSNSINKEFASYAANLVSQKKKGYRIRSEAI